MADVKRIFTFWEPKENIPGYISLCIETWKKFLPDYEIVILDYSNLDEWLGKNYFDRSLYKNFSIAMQADAIRCAILKNFGGVWLDADTILLSDKCKELFNSDSEYTSINIHLAFIVAKPNAYVLNLWEKGVKRNIFLYKYVKMFRLHKIFKKVRQKFQNWDVLGNAVLNPIVLSLKDNKKYVNCFYAKDMKCFPERICIQDKKIDIIQKYKTFYFENDYSDKAMEIPKSVILLHNSWTPEEYKKMSIEEFMSHKNTLTGVFKKLGVAEIYSR